MNVRCAFWDTTVEAVQNSETTPSRATLTRAEENAGKGGRSCNKLVNQKPGSKKKASEKSQDLKNRKFKKAVSDYKKQSKKNSTIRG